MLYTTKEINFILERIDKQLYLLSDWETNFINSIKKQLQNNQSLTPHQNKKLNEIWDKVDV